MPIVLERPPALSDAPLTPDALMDTRILVGVLTRYLSEFGPLQEVGQSRSQQRCLLARTLARVGYPESTVTRRAVVFRRHLTTIARIDHTRFTLALVDAFDSLTDAPAPVTRDLAVIAIRQALAVADLA